MDVQIDGRFRAYTEVGGIIVRALSDLDVQERRKVALLASEEEREELGNKEGDHYKELVVESLEDATEGVLREALLQFAVADLTRDAEDLLPFRFVPFPNDASLEERHGVLRQREEHEAEIRAERLKYVDQRVDKLREKSLAWEYDVLLRETERKIVESWIWAKYTQVFQYQTLVLSCFKDGAPLFKCWEDVPKNSDKFVKRLFSAYREVDSVDPWELEKNVLTEPTTD